MLTLADIAHHITQALSAPDGAAPKASLESIPAPCLPNMRLCITADVEATELSYLRRFGRGHTFYFRLQDSASGEKLAGELIDLVPGASLNGGFGMEDGLEADRPLYLFLHILQDDTDAPLPYRRKRTEPFQDSGAPETSLFIKSTL